MIYRKQGSVVRWENGTVIRVDECGLAVERGELFECMPERGPFRATLEWEPADVAAVAAGIERMVRPLTLERLLIVDGYARHEYGDRHWTDSTQRIHLSIARGQIRALLDLATFDPDDIVRVVAALGRASTAMAEPPPLLRVAPNVTAALLPGLVGLAPPNVRLLQTAVGIDGKGADIVEASGAWPNWYRPSYRVRPLRMPLNLRLECDVTHLDAGHPMAVALLAPVSELTMQVLIDDGGRAWPSTVRLTRIDAVSASRVWYPYGGGSFGAEMML